MVDKGNFKEIDPQETPRIEKLFGKDIKVYPNAKIDNFNYKNWFRVGNFVGLWKKDTHSRIPKYPEDPKRDATKETNSYQDYLEAIGTMYYGASFDPATNTFIDNPELPPRPNLKAIQDRARNLAGVGMIGQTDVPKGYSKQSVEDAINLLIALDLYGKKMDDEPFDPSEEETEYALLKADRNKFRISPKIQEWKEIAMSIGGTSEQKIEKNIDMLYRFMVISGHTGYPAHYTKGYRDHNVIQKTILLKKDVEKFKHWAMTRLTPPEWYKIAKDDGFIVQEGDMKNTKLELNVYADKVKPFLNDWERKLPSIKQWKQGSSGIDQVKQVADALASFVKYSGGDHTWSIPDPQPISSVLSRRIKDPTKASLGVRLTDKEVMSGMKFLETGQRHIWVESETETESITEIVDGKEKTYKVPKQVLIADKTDTDPHFNTHLKIYDSWGDPYGETAPANMFFRIALSGTGWRKAEALTCQNQFISKTTAPDKKSGIYWKDEKLRIVFQTRKTERLGGDWVQHTSTIPPTSSELIDSKHTIEIVLKKNNRYRLTMDDRIYEEIPMREREEARPAKRMGKTRGQRFWDRKLGETSKCLIGFNNQFIATDLLTAKTGNELHFHDPAINAYLFVPFKEMYSMMSKGTGVTIRSKAEQKAQRKIIVDDKWGGFDRTYKQTKRAKSRSDKIDPATIYFPVDEWGWAKSNTSSKFQNEVWRIRQDKERWDDIDEYWIRKPLHSIRHVFAQTWLRKSKWNFGLVALIGHWKIIDTLKLHYGDRDDDDVIDQLSGLMAESDDENKTKRIKDKLMKIYTKEDAGDLKKKTADQELTKSEKKTILGSDAEGEDAD